MSKLGTFLRLRDEGSAAVEFAVIAPLFCLIFAGTIDIAFALHTKFSMNSALSSATSYALLNAGKVSSQGGEELAARIATIVAGNQSSETDVSVTVNNGPAAMISNGVLSASGAKDKADSCYCPTRQGGSLTWGNVLACGTPCAGDTASGKFVSISATRSYTPLFTGYRFIDGDTLPVATLVRTQ